MAVLHQDAEGRVANRGYREAVQARIAERAHLLFEDAGMISHLADLLVGAFKRTASR